MSSLRQLLGMQPDKPQLSEHQAMARRLIRHLTLLGFTEYDVWEITNEMERLSLSANDYPDLFPHNQRPVKVQINNDGSLSG